MLRLLNKRFFGSGKGPHREIKRERRYRQGIKDLNIDDFTQHQGYKNMLQDKQKMFQASQTKMKLSAVAAE